MPRKAPSAEGSNAGNGVAQHYFLRALKWVVEAENTAELTDQMRLWPITADEKAVQSLVAASRTFVPALRELRNKAVDREVLESLASGKNRSLVTRLSGDGDQTSDGESSACDFGVDDASSGEEDKGGAPLVLPPSWKTQVVRRGKAVIREYVDGRGMRYKTEQQARRAVDASRRSANMASRLRERFVARVSAGVMTVVKCAETEPSGAAMAVEMLEATPDEKRSRMTGTETL